MFIWVAENVGTIITVCVLLAAVALAIRKLVRDKAAGKNSCIYGNGDCSKCNRKCR